jgi:uncharacterized protein YlzI (FlbEa/FlbD family)
VIGLRTLDGATMYLNEDMVERVEGGANSAVYLGNGTYFVVRDDVDTISERIRSEKQAVLAGALALAFGDTPAPALAAVAPVALAEDDRCRDEDGTA